MQILPSPLAQASDFNIYHYPILAVAAVACFLLFLAVIYIVCAFSMRKAFTKAGEPGWAVWIPIFNLVVLLRVAGLDWYWVFAPLIVFAPSIGPIACLIGFIWVNYRISNRFGHGIGITIGLTLLPMIYWDVLGSGPSKYIGNNKPGPKAHP